MVIYKNIINQPTELKVSLLDKAITIYNDKYSYTLKLPKFMKLELMDNNRLLIETTNRPDLKTISTTIQSLFDTIIAPCKVVVMSNVMGSKFQEYNGNYYVKAGYSHFIKLPNHSDCYYTILTQTSIMITSPFKDKATNLAATICNMKKPDAYKGRGLYVETQEPRIFKTIKKQ